MLLIPLFWNAFPTVWCLNLLKVTHSNTRARTNYSHRVGGMPKCEYWSVTLKEKAWAYVQRQWKRVVEKNVWTSEKITQGDKENLVIEKLCGLHLSSVTIRLMDQVEALRRILKNCEKFRTTMRLEKLEDLTFRRLMSTIVDAPHR